jgi:hypothetical protein
MEIVVFVALVCIVAVLAMRFGHDGRQTVFSKEEELASLGMVRDQADAAPPSFRAMPRLPPPAPKPVVDRERPRVVATDSVARSA